MKKLFKTLLILFIVLLCIAVSGVILFFGILFAGVFSACQNSGTVLFNDATIPTASFLKETSNGRYLRVFVYGREYLYDTQENQMTPVETSVLTDVYEVLLLEDRLEKHCITSIPIYDKTTGKIDHTEYYKTVVLFSPETGEEYHRYNLVEDPMDEDEKIAFLESYSSADPDPETVGIENVASFCLTNSSAYDRAEKSLDPETLNSTEKAIYSYVESLCDIDDVGFYWAGVNARRQGDEIFFLVTLCNKKGFSGQRPILKGLQGSMLVRYEEDSNTFTTLMELGKGCVILGFDETNAICYDNGILYSTDIASGSRRELMEIGNELHAAGTDEYLFLSEYDAEEGTRYLILTYDGELLCQGDLY